MYAELHCKTNYSFLTGGSHADELVHQAAALGYSALAITDENSLAGIVRAYAAAKESPVKLIVGAEIIPNDAPPVVLWAPTRTAYAQLSRLITVGRRRAPKGECWLELDDIAAHNTELLAGVVPALVGDRSRVDHIDSTHPSHEWFFRRSLSAGQEQCYRELFGERAYLLAELYQGVDDHWRISQLQQLSQQTLMPLVAAGDVLYHFPSRLPLHDVLTAIKHRTTVDQADELLLPNAQRHLQTILQRQAAFAEIPDALTRNLEIADRCSFCLSQLRYEYPEELAPNGKTPLEHLRQLTFAGARQRYADNIPNTVQLQLNHELKLIQELKYEAYFLTVWDLVRFARNRGILCQGRGSAANSAVCYCLGVTSVDPSTTDLLFERFVSKERDEPPDIDVDFEHERREEVLQYLYEKYGRDRAGLAATVITYRVRSAVRDVGKALGLSLDRVDALAKQVEGYSPEDSLAARMDDVGVDPYSQIGRHLEHLVHEIIGFPRHLSQHVGGMVITQGKLNELVPIENASMDGRTVIQWDKQDLEELGLLKVDCLCLGMLTAIRKCFDLLNQHWDQQVSLATVPREDPLVYDMICQADTVGVFQIESRGQMSMLPRLRPRCWYDLVIEVAIVRPGPIQGNMVHPYLRRRNGEEQAVYPNRAIRGVLERTLGVPIFQEQAMKLAVVAAGFTPGEADQLRRAMGAWRKTGVIEKFREKMMLGMRERGLDATFADQVFRQIRGFGEYGFPESHAASFALLVYVSAWLKRHYPAAFTAAILNSQPMGFYAPAQLIADVRQHDVQVLPVDVNHSEWDCTLETRASSLSKQTNEPAQQALNGDEPNPPRRSADRPPSVNDYSLRLGMRMISGLSIVHAESILKARRKGTFSSIADLTRRARLGQSVVTQLSAADAFNSMNQDRRTALWQALAQEQKPMHQPLFDTLDCDDDKISSLPPLSAEQQVLEDYRTTGLSLKAHPIAFHREQLDQWRITSASQLKGHADNRHTRVAGIVTLRQRPSTAKGITFVTLEDETGTVNLVVKPSIWERYYKIARQSPAWIAHGKLENRKGVIHVVVNRIEDLSERLGDHHIQSRDFH
ncbi:MAG: error-prone DNA polymerase [Mariniblastus sp.]|nr:error-prone DNA polymerase [Mariniblastus sp.]